MIQFNLNDRVYSNMQKKYGKIIRIRSEMANCNVPFLVEFDNGFSMWTTAEDLSMAKLNKFKVGDRIIGVTRHHKGEFGTIFRIYNDLDYCTVEWDSGIISNKAIDGIKLTTAEDKYKPIIVIDLHKIFQEWPKIKIVKESDIPSLYTKNGKIRMSPYDYIQKLTAEYERINTEISVLKLKQNTLKRNICYVQEELKRYDDK